MSRTNNKYRIDIIMQLLERDGNLCQGCKSHFLDDVRLIRVDHIDGDENHNCLENKRLVCNSFNVKLRQKSTMNGCVCACGYAPALASMLADPNAHVVIEDHGPESDYITVRKTRPSSSSVSVLKKSELEADRKEAERLQEQKEDAALTPTMRKNKKSEKPFNDWLTKGINDGMRFDFETWCNAGATEFKCSPETTRKYLNKRTNPINGDLTAIFDGKLTYLGFRE